MYEYAGIILFFILHVAVIVAYGICIGRIWAKGGPNKWMGITVTTLAFIAPITWLAHAAFPHFGDPCFKG